MDIPDVDEVYPLTPEGQWAIPPSPNPELEIEKADMQRRTLEGKVRGEIDAAVAEADISLKLAQAEMLRAEIDQLGQGDASDRIKVIAEQMKTQREERKGKIDLLLKLMDLQIKKEELEIKREEAKLDMEVKEHDAENKKQMSDDKVETTKKISDQKVTEAKKKAQASGKASNTKK